MEGYRPMALDKLAFLAYSFSSLVHLPGVLNIFNKVPWYSNPYEIDGIC
jgi:hypothetical protein